MLPGCCCFVLRCNSATVACLTRHGGCLPPSQVEMDTHMGLNLKEEIERLRQMTPEDATKYIRQFDDSYFVRPQQRAKQQQ